MSIKVDHYYVASIFGLILMTKLKTSQEKKFDCVQLIAHFLSIGVAQ